MGGFVEGSGGARGAQAMSPASHSSWGGGSSLGGFSSGGGGGGGSQPPQPPHECIVRVKARPYSPADDLKPRRIEEPSPVVGLGGGGGAGGGAAAAGGGVGLGGAFAAGEALSR